MGIPLGLTSARGVARHDLPEFLVPHQYTIKGLKFLERFWLERFTLVSMDEPTEPLPQLSRL